MAVSINLVNDEMLIAAYDSLFKTMTIIDIREPSEYAREHISGSRNIPMQQLEETDFSVEKDQAVLFHCQRGPRTHAAQQRILATGFKKIYCLEGGIEQWIRCGLSIEMFT